jgi:hypothetical protein
MAGGLLKKIRERIGTMTTQRPVKKPPFVAVVMVNPQVWKAKAAKRKIPRNVPAWSSEPRRGHILFRKRMTMRMKADPNLAVRKAKTSTCATACFTMMKVVPQNRVTKSKRRSILSCCFLEVIAYVPKGYKRRLFTRD